MKWSGGEGDVREKEGRGRGVGVNGREGKGEMEQGWREVAEGEKGEERRGGGKGMERARIGEGGG